MKIISIITDLSISNDMHQSTNHIEKNPKTYPMIVQIKGDELMCSFLPDTAKSIESYMEISIEKTDEAFNMLMEKIVTLNILGESEEIENFGAKFADGVFSVYLTKEQFESIANHPVVVSSYKTSAYKKPKE